MEELIKITPNENGDQVVSARELHCFLESKQDFSNWMKNRIDKYGFIENHDFVSFNKIIEREKGASTRIEYALTLDMAKELSMVEANEKGQQARRYFIACEKAALALTTRIASPKELAQMVIDAENAKEEAERKLAIAMPRVDYVEQVLNSGSFRTVNEIAMDLGITNQKLNKLLCEKGIQYYQNGRYMLYAQYRNKGYAQNHTDIKNGHTFTYMVWSETGRAFIHSILNNTMIASIANKQSSIKRLNPGKNGAGN